MKVELQPFGGLRKVYDIDLKATEGAAVGVNLTYNGVVVLWEDIYNGANGGATPGVSVSDWSLILNIPAPITTLATLAGTGFVFVTSPTTYSVVSTAGAIAGSVPQYNGSAWVMGTALSNPMTTLGDIITGDVGGAPKRLGIGAADQVLGEVAGQPAYVNRLIEVVAGSNVTVDDTDPMRPIIASVGGGGEGGIGVAIGTFLSSATVLPVAMEAVTLSNGGYDLTGEWYMWCYPSGSIEIDVWADTFGVIPTVADSICGGAEPAIVAGTFATGTFTGPVSIARTDTLVAHINSNTNVKWVKLLLIGDRT